MTIEELLTKYRNDISNLINLESDTTLIGDLTLSTYKLWRNRVEKKEITPYIEIGLPTSTQTQKLDTVNTRTYEVNMDVEKEYLMLSGYHIDLPKHVCYTIVSSNKSKDGNYLCPKCGAITTDVGCNHCSTQLIRNDLTGKVVSAFRSEKKVGVTTGKKNIWIAGMISILVLLVGITSSTIIPVVVIFILWSIMCKVEYNTLRQPEQEIYKLLESTNGFFNLDNFLYNVETKIKMLHYASSTEEVGAIAHFPELTQFVGSMANCVYVDVNRLSIDAAIPSWDVEYAEHGCDSVTFYIDAKLYIVQESNGKIKTMRERGKIKVCRRTDAPNSCNDAVLYRCRKCGMHLDINQLVCKHCGTSIDLKYTDWVIIEYNTTIK